MEGGAVGHNFDRETHKDHSIFGKLIWFSGYKREDLNLIFYQNMLNLHKWYKSGERNFLQIGREYMLNYSFACSISKNLSSF
jgi:hypothetical protein